MWSCFRFFGPLCCLPAWDCYAGPPAETKGLMGFEAHQDPGIVIWVPGSVCSQDLIIHTILVLVQVTDLC